MSKSIYQVFFFIHCLSLDVALGSCAILYSVLHCGILNQDANMLPYYCLLFIGTLIIYWIDHLLDSKNPLLVQEGMRHTLFKKYRKSFIVILFVLFVLNATIALHYLSMFELLAGILLLLGLYSYLILHQKVKRKIILEKEILIAILYSFSVLFTPLSLCFSQGFGYNLIGHLLIGGLVFLMALQNLFSMAIIEKEIDSTSHVKSISQVFGPKRLKRLQFALLGISMFLYLFLYLIFQTQAIKVFIEITFCIGMIQLLLPYFFISPKNHLYRIIADSTFILGFLCYFS